MHSVPATPQLVPSATLFARHAPEPLHVSGLSHGPLDELPHDVPAALYPLSWQTPDRHVSWFVHAVPASPQFVPSAATFARHVPALSHGPDAGFPQAVPAGASGDEHWPV